MVHWAWPIWLMGLSLITIIICVVAIALIVYHLYSCNDHSTPHIALKHQATNENHNYISFSEHFINYKLIEFL